jgi:hypothetical protein
MNLSIEKTACFADARGRPSKSVERFSRKLLAKAAPLLERVGARRTAGQVAAVKACRPMDARC